MERAAEGVARGEYAWPAGIVGGGTGPGRVGTCPTSWLPDMDLNHDKQIQSLLCYRYTIGQSVRAQRLGIRS